MAAYRQFPWSHTENFNKLPLIFWNNLLHGTVLDERRDVNGRASYEEVESLSDEGQSHGTRRQPPIAPRVHPSVHPIMSEPNHNQRHDI